MTYQYPLPWRLSGAGSDAPGSGPVTETANVAQNSFAIEEVVA